MPAAVTGAVRVLVRHIQGRRTGEGCSMKARLVAALLTAGLISPANAADVVRTYSYYTIGGSTLAAILKQLDRRGPEVKATGHRHPGAMEAVFTSRVRYQGAKGCRVASAQVTVNARIILPYWRRPRAAGPEVQLVWDTLSADIRRHEESHVIIARNHARLLEQALRAMPRQPDCEAAIAKAAIVTEQVLDRLNAAQAEFDRVEAINFDSRIRRLLQNRMERLAQ